MRAIGRRGAGWRMPPLGALTVRSAPNWRIRSADQPRNLFPINDLRMRPGWHVPCFKSSIPTSEAVPDVHRTRRKTDEGSQGRVRRPALRRHARRAAPRHLPEVDHRARPVRGRQDVRRLLDQRLEGHQRVRHGAAARSEHRVPGSVHRRSDPGADLRHPRSGDDAGLFARPARRRQARRGLSQGQRHRRAGVLRPRARILHLRFGALRQRDGPHLLPHRFGRGALELGQGIRRRQQRLSPRHQGRLLPGRAARLVARPACRDVQDARAGRHRSGSAPPRSRQCRPVRDRHQVQLADPARPTSC